ncbi:hypothetical protein ABIB75_008079 [Bradyrhizobium sp. GM2.2]
MHAFATAIAVSTFLLRREGWWHGQNKTRRIYRELGLQLSNKTPKRRIKPSCARIAGHRPGRTSPGRLICPRSVGGGA